MKHMQSFKSESATVYKVIVSQKKDSTLNHLNKLFLKQIQAISCWPQHDTLAYCPPHLLCAQNWGKTWPSVDFRIGLNENANSFFATRCRFWRGKIAVSPVTAVHKQHAHYQALQAWWMEMKSTNRTNHCRLASCRRGLEKWIVERIVWESLSILYKCIYKTNKVFFDLACMSTCCWGFPKPKYEPFITHNRGTLKQVCHT